MFVWVLRGRPIEDAAVDVHLTTWTDRYGDSPGYLGAFGGATTDGTFAMMVFWESQDAADALLGSGGPVEWYRLFERECFDGELEFVETEQATVGASGPDHTTDMRSDQIEHLFIHAPVVG